MYFRSLLFIASVLNCCILAQADAPPPPLGENLVLDCTFTDPLESTPWQAESGAIADMLCPSGGCGNCAEQVNVLRFRGRDTDDILAVRQTIELPPASSFDLSFDLKYCDTSPTGTVSFSLGNFDLYTITIATRPTSGVRNFTHSFDNSGDSSVQPAGLVELVIANPALSGNDIMVDNVRIVARYAERECTLDPALFGSWQRKVNGGSASEDAWTFNENGTFHLNAMRGYYDEQNGECCISGSDYQGAWCVDMAQTPPAIYLRVDGEGYYESKSAKAEKVFEPDCGAPERAWYGRYQIDGGQLSLRVQECPNPIFDSPAVFLNSGFASDNGAPLIAPCETPDGEGAVEAEATEAENTEGEGAVDGEAENATEAEAGTEAEIEEGEGQTGPSVADIIQGFLAADINDDRALSRTEAEALSIPTALFDSIDANEDGFIHVGEAFWAAGDTAPRHTSDQDLNGTIELDELLRAIQFYNAGGYSCAPFAESEDGYLPQPYAGRGVDPACPAHASDYNPADGKVSLSELLRIIQLFNASNYTACPGSGEDGFCLS